MPGYGTQPADEGTGLLPWSWAVSRLRAAHDYWLATTWPDGGAHVMPVWGVWHDDALWFATGPDERKAENLARNPGCALTAGRSELSDGGLDVVLEGAAVQVSDEVELQLVAEAFGRKYGTTMWDFVVRDGAFEHRSLAGRVLVFRVRPARGLGFRKGDAFSQTTWRFER
jgi:nitroimidazol reductase NimA-like FMN-containing flavoprotein (pyridoxamine 5'-phosphate oxidase superfamily)